MPSPKEIKRRMKSGVNTALLNGNVFDANEITANMMVGVTMIIMFALMLICLGLNEIGVFTADKQLMRIGVLVAAIFEIPMATLVLEKGGNDKRIKIPIMADMIIVCAILAGTLGHNVTLIMVFPVVISTRYFDKRFTLNVSLATLVIFAIVTAGCGALGILNLNMLKLPEGTEIVIKEGQTLRDAIVENGFDKFAYVKSLYLNDFLPRCVQYLALTVSCSYISKRGRDMILNQAETAKKSSRIETELDLATKIQKSMLPCLLPAFPSHKNIDLRAVYYPAKEVGGDFYDYFNIDDTHVGVVIADVSGKGVGAALFMTISKTVIKNQLLLNGSPAQAINNANQQLCETNEAELFVTCWAGVYNTETGVLTYVNAGHNPPVLLRKGKDPEFLIQKNGLVLAAFDDYEYKQEEMKLEVGDEIFFYTDGVTEATNANNELYSDKQLLECLKHNKTREVEEQINALKLNIDKFVGEADQFDDITIMAMRINHVNE